MLKFSPHLEVARGGQCNPAVVWRGEDFGRGSVFNKAILDGGFRSGEGRRRERREGEGDLHLPQEHAHTYGASCLVT